MSIELRGKIKTDDKTVPGGRKQQIQEYYDHEKQKYRVGHKKREKGGKTLERCFL